MREQTAYAVDRSRRAAPPTRSRPASVTAVESPRRSSRVRDSAASAAAVAATLPAVARSVVAVWASQLVAGVAALVVLAAVRIRRFTNALW